MRTRVGAGFDPAFRSDACAGVIVYAIDGHFFSAVTFERRPAKGLPLVPSVVTREFAELAKRYGAKRIATDSFYVESVREHVREVGLSLLEAPAGQQGKAGLHALAREHIHGARVHIPGAQRRLVQQLRDVLSKPLPGGGMSITSPRKRGMHGDLASAFVLAIWAAIDASKQRIRNSWGGYVSPNSWDPSLAPLAGSSWSMSSGGDDDDDQDAVDEHAERKRRFYNDENPRRRVIDTGRGW